MRTPQILSSRLGLFSLLVILLACESTEEPVDVCTGSNLAVSVSSTTNSTCGAPDGTIVVLGSGGMGPYTYSIDGNTFQTSSTFEMVSAGAYTITIKDANECTSSIPAEIMDESNLGVTVTSSSTDCGSSQGSIMVTANGGTPGYMYKIGNESFQSDNNFVDLSPGNYSVTVQDSEGCEFSETHRVLSNTSWMNDILPIINTRCALSGCHNGSTGLPNWTNLTVVQANASNIKSRTSSGTMPPSSATPLTSEQISLIACWVDDGARNN